MCKTSDVPRIEFDDEEDVTDQLSVSAKERFLNSINRGGLVTPSDLVYLCVLHALKLHNKIFGDPQVRLLFLGFAEPRKVFVNSFSQLIDNDTSAAEIIFQRCQSGHEFTRFVSNIAFKLFNIVSKNLISEINDKIHEAKKRQPDTKASSSRRKIAKLQSD